MDKKILELKSISKTFGKTKALNNVDFDLYPGEIHCLVGENGAGKSTLIKILSGAEIPDHGEINLFSKSYESLTPNQAIEKGVATIYQDIELIDSLTVADNIFLGNEKKGKYSKIDFKYQNKKARELMDSINIKISETKRIEELSASDKQTLQIVKALHIDAKILIMDEPTASLGIEETKALIELIRKLASQGIGIIYITHYLEEVFEIGDRITVLKDGEKVKTFEADKVELEEITTSMIGRERNKFFQREKAEKGEVILSVENLNFRNKIKDISFELKKGEILGFGGIVGAGRTELMNTIFGVTKKDSGLIKINNEEVNISNPREALDHGIAMIPEDRVEQGLLNLRSVLENIAIISNQDSLLYLNHEKEKELVQQMIDTLNIVTEGLDKAAGYLSGGNQQKTVIARWLLSKADIFIFDEPTKGVDIGAKEQIYDLITELAQEGKGILMVSSDMPELISMSDRIAVMRENSLVDIIPAAETDEHQLLEIFLGIENNGGNDNAKF